MKIRTATLQDLAAVTALEAACFPAAEAAPEAAFRARLETYPESFWVMTDEADRPLPWSTACVPTRRTCTTRCTKTPPSTTERESGR